MVEVAALGAAAPFLPAFCADPGLLRGVWVAAGAAASAEAGTGPLAAAAASTSGPGAASTGVGTVAAASAASVVAVAEVTVVPSAGWLNMASTSDTAFRTAAAGTLRASSCAAASAAMPPTSLCSSASQGAQAASWHLVVWMAARRAIRTGRHCCNSSVAASCRRS